MGRGHGLRPAGIKEGISTPTIRQAYFRWLYSLVFDVYEIRDHRSYTNVCARLHSVKFNDSVPNDDNRSAEGEELRNEFIASLKGIDIGDYAELHNLGKCSLFEMMIALARRADFSTEIGVPEWFRQFFINLGLMKYHDPACNTGNSFRIDKIIRILNDRRYSASGKGGLFPLTRPREDQRHTEIWNQMNAFIIENQMFY